MYLCELGQHQQKSIAVTMLALQIFSLPLPRAHLSVRLKTSQSYPSSQSVSDLCSSTAMKRHHCMEESSLEQLTPHSFGGRINPKGCDESISQELLKIYLTYYTGRNTWRNYSCSADKTFAPKRWRSHLMNATITSFDWGCWDTVLGLLFVCLAIFCIMHC